MKDLENEFIKSLIETGDFEFLKGFIKSKADKEATTILLQESKKIFVRDNFHSQRKFNLFKNQYACLHKKLKDKLKVVDKDSGNCLKRKKMKKTKVPHSLEKITKSCKIEEIVIKEISSQQFDVLRALFLSKSVKTFAPAQKCYGLFSKDKLFGAFGFATDFRFNTPAELEKPTIYLIADFVVSPSSVKKLSKLVLYCILSKEVKLLAERFVGKKVNTIYTNVFTDKSVSMKYRGVFDILRKQKISNNINNIGYGANMGKWSLEEGLNLWKRK
ncbi:MAG: hypothetical protein FWB72_04090 [Firmicutes bacterium]|nr:hypothetical protein [Bacillota bacterium]